VKSHLLYFIDSLFGVIYNLSSRHALSPENLLPYQHPQPYPQICVFQRFNLVIP